MTTRLWCLFPVPQLSAKGARITSARLVAEYRLRGVRDIEVRIFTTLRDFLQAFRVARETNVYPTEIRYAGCLHEDMFGSGTVSIQQFLTEHHLKISGINSETRKGFMTTDVHLIHLKPFDREKQIFGIRISTLLIFFVIAAMITGFTLMH